MTDTILVLNAGSSSIKFQVFRLCDLDLLAAGKVTGIGGHTQFKAAIPGGENETRDLSYGTDHEHALAAVLSYIHSHEDGWHTAALAHRIVHGGTKYTMPVRITPQVLEELTALAPLAPLHQPHNLAAVVASERLVGHVPDFACFDTAFHAGQDELFNSLAVNATLRAKGVRRYGFHGISYQWIARELAARHPKLAAGRVVAAHLGNGASLCAMQAGRSVDTTMGMTALDGLPMGTRSGAIDAGAVIYMQRTLGLSPDAAEAELYEHCGLLGLSGITNDVKELLDSRDPKAKFALDYFVLKAAQFTAAMAVAMGGIDALVFTGGIGEHATPVRDAIVQRLEFLGPFQTLVIPTNEELMMAIEAKKLLETSA